MLVCQILSVTMLVLVVLFAVVWTVAMLSGVTKTIRRRRSTALAARRATASLKFDRDGDSTVSLAWPSKLLTEPESSSAPQPLHTPGRSLFASAPMTALPESQDNFDHPGDSVFTTPLSATTDNAVGAVSVSEPESQVDASVEMKRSVGDTSGTSHLGDFWMVNPLRRVSMAAALRATQSPPA